MKKFPITGALEGGSGILTVNACGFVAKPLKEDGDPLPLDPSFL